MIETELTEPASLCSESGTLDPAAVGWSRSPLHRCNLSGHWPRKKRWNCWTIFTERCLFSAGIADLDYATTAFVYLIDLTRGRVIERSTVLPLRIGAPRLPDHVAASLSLRTKRASVTMTGEGDHTSLLVAWEDFFEGDRLSAAFQVQHPADHDSLGVVVPWSERRFAYTCKNLALPAQGRLRIGYREIPFDAGTAFAVFDFTRGIWPRRTAWNHGAACGRIVQRDGGDNVPEHVLGINLGGKWTDGTGCTENAIWLDGRVSKISEDLVWEYDTANLRARWRVRAPESQVLDLLFTPSVERVARTDARLVSYTVHQLFGYYSGTLRSHTGETIEVRDLFGWAGQHRALW
ncbi:MAG: DUF2804 domain-containing protein [Deltaproteobacteria bacterium]|nr:DUF2804 domain-containing protein [Deltaproteobacteria bacterium]